MMFKYLTSNYCVLIQSDKKRLPFITLIKMIILFMGPTAFYGKPQVPWIWGLGLYNGPIFAVICLLKEDQCN